MGGSIARVFGREDAPDHGQQPKDGMPGADGRGPAQPSFFDGEYSDASLLGDEDPVLLMPTQSMDVAALSPEIVIEALSQEERRAVRVVMDQQQRAKYLGIVSDLCTQQRCRPMTYFAAVDLFDRALPHRIFDDNLYYCACCFWMACKMEERMAPSTHWVSERVFGPGSGRTAALIEGETRIARALGFEVYRSNPFIFSNAVLNNGSAHQIVTELYLFCASFHQDYATLCPQEVAETCRDLAALYLQMRDLLPCTPMVRRIVPLVYNMTLTWTKRLTNMLCSICRACARELNFSYIPFVQSLRALKPAPEPDGHGTLVWPAE